MFKKFWSCSWLGCTLMEAWPTCSSSTRPKPKQKENSVKVINQQVTPLLAIELERYLILDKKIGMGSTSMVHAGLDTLNGHKVAMKIMPLTSNNCMDLMRERDINLRVARTGHENILQCLDVFQNGYKMTIITELMAGGDLLSAIPPNQGLPMMVALSYARQLLSALSFLHSNGTAHRDVKPENCLLSADRTNLKLGDFGHAVRVGSLMVSRESHGTLPYMSPEVVAENVLDHYAADVWSAGCVAFAMITGRFPWRLAKISNKDFQLHIQCLQGEETRPEWISFPIPLQKLLSRMLAISPAERPTAHQAIALVDAVIMSLNVNYHAKNTSEESLCCLDLSAVKCRVAAGEV